MPRIGTIKLYGAIHEWSENSAQNFETRFSEIVKKSDEIALHIHCPGGSVFEGNVIYNIVQNSPIPVDIYVDGIAASMGSIIMLAGRSLCMSENAYVMIHAPSGYTEGDASMHEKTGKLLRSMERMFKKLYIAKTGKTEKEVLSWMEGDNWFSAQEALDNGFIDAIVDKVDSTEIASETHSSPQAMYSKYTALNTNLDKKLNIKKQVKQMEKQNLIQTLALTGVDANSSDAQITAAIELKIKTEKEAKEAALATIAKTEDERIENAITAAKKGGKITDKQTDFYRSLGAKIGAEALEVIFNDTQKASPTSSLSAIISSVQSGGEAAYALDRKNWDFEKWQKEDPKGLEKLPEAEKQLLIEAWLNK